MILYAFVYFVLLLLDYFGFPIFSLCLPDENYSRQKHVVCTKFVPGADNRYLALCVLMASEQKVNIMAEETGSRFLAVDETETYLYSSFHSDI
jgi:hypothetical protein